MTTQPIDGDYNSIEQSLEEIILQENTMKSQDGRDQYGRANASGINNFMVAGSVTKNPTSRKNVIPAKSSNQRGVFNGLHTGLVN